MPANNHSFWSSKAFAPASSLRQLLLALSTPSLDCSFWSVSQSVTLSDDDVQCVWMDDVVDGGGGGSQESQLS